MRHFSTCQLSRAALLPLLASLSLLTSSCSVPSSTAEQIPAVAVREPEDASSSQQVRLISQEQYFNTLSHMFGESIRLPGRFPPFNRADGLESLGASSASVTIGGVQLYQQAASSVAAQIVNEERRSFFLPCQPADPKAPNNACARTIIGKIGFELYRRPLSENKLEQLVHQAASSAERMGDFYAGLASVLEGMLVDPNVLFLVERSEDDPEAPGHKRLDAYSFAARLSLFLWNAMPDEFLLNAAKDGTLDSARGREKVVDAMLRNPRLKEGVRAFFSDMLKFSEMDNLAKDPTVYPAFTDLVSRDAREETLRTIIDHLIDRNEDYRDLFTTRRTYLSPTLAAVYGVPSSGSWSPYAFAEDSRRMGLLTQISFLASHAHPARSSPTRRGQALRELFLCQIVPPPPPNVDFSAVENPKANLRTARDRVGVHLENPVCAGCHKITDPIGLGLENYDGAGQYRQAENGVVLDVSGNLDGKQFQDIAGLAERVHDHPALTSCVVQRLYSYAVGAASRSDREIIKAFNDTFAEHGYRLPNLLRAIALSKAFSSLKVANEDRADFRSAEKMLIAAN